MTTYLAPFQSECSQNVPPPKVLTHGLFLLALSSVGHICHSRARSLGPGSLCSSTDCWLSLSAGGNDFDGNCVKWMEQKIVSTRRNQDRSDNWCLESS